MDTEYVKLFTETSIIINGLKNQLEAQNIKCIIKDRFESARLGGYGEHSASVEIHVLNTDLGNAKQLLTEYRKKIYS